MAVITKVSAQKHPGRYNIFLDGHYAFSASAQTVAQFVLLKGKELTADDVGKVKQADADAKATDLAAHFLSYEPRTITEVRHYLVKHHLSETACDDVVKELSNLGYLDDKNYVKLFLKNNLRVGKDGPRSLRRKLRQKGVASELIAAGLDEVKTQDWLVIGQKVIKSMTQQAGRFSVRELKRKMRSRLLRHGFDGALASEIVAQAPLKEDPNYQQEALKHQGIKAYKHFRRLPERERNFKIKKYLYQHGFSSTEIDAFLDGEIIDLTDLAAY